MATTPTPQSVAQAGYSSVADFNRFNNPIQTSSNTAPTSGRPSTQAEINAGTSNSTNTSSSSAPVNNYSVVTSNPANTKLAGIQDTYNTQIKPAVTTATQTNATNTQQQNQIPVTTGFSPYTTTKTENPGEVSTTVNGQSYYATPVNPNPTSSDIASILSGATNPTPTTGGAPSTQPGAQTPAQTAQSQTGINPTDVNNQYQTSVNQINDAVTSAASSFQSVIQSLSAGSIPFTPAQQSLIDATNSAFNQMTTNANLKAAALSSQTGGVSNMTNAMGGQLIGIATDQAAAIARMEVGFQTENYNEKYQTVTAAYDAFTKAETAKMEALTKIHDSVMTTYQNAVQAAQKQQEFNQTVYKDAAQLAQSNTEFRDKFDSMGTKIGTDVYDKTTGALLASHYDAGHTNPTTGVTTPIVTADPNTGTVDETSQAAYLATLPPQYQALVQGIANGKIEPPSARTAMGAKILAMVTQYDPTLSDGTGGFDATRYAARLTMSKGLANSTPGSLGGAMKVANTVIAHLGSFLNSASSLPGKGASSSVNSLVTAGLGLVNPTIQKNYAQADIISKGLTDEMTKFFKGTGGTDVQSIKSWGDSLNPNASGGTLAGTIQGGLDLFGGQFNTFLQQYRTVMGKDADISTLIQPQTMATLSAFKNAGFKIDIPGIPYTDVNAYVNAAPENKAELDTVRSAYPNLTPEQALQLAQYNQNQ